MEYKLITEERFDDAIGHLREFFFTDEPLNRAVGLCRNGEGIRELEQYCYETLEDNLSLMVVNEDDNIVGVILNGVLHPGYMACAQKKVELCKDENFKKILQLHYTLSLQVDIFECFDVDKAFHLRIATVDKRFRGQGITMELLRRSEQMARDFEFKLMKAVVSSMYSHKIFKSYGFKELGEIYYNKYVDECGKPVFSVEAPHTKLQSMYKLLD